MKHFIFVAAIFALIGCESQFPGNRDFSLSALNGPYGLKVVTIGGTNYLGVINSNFHFDASDGSLHFYSIASPRAPQLNTSLSLRIPTGVSDFEVSDDVLILSDRSRHQLLFYDLSAGAFTQRLEANGDPKVIKLTDNPQRLLVFNRNPDALKVLAVASQSSGVVHFIRLDTLAFISAGVETPSSRDTITVRDIVGANFYMQARQEQEAGKDDHIGVSRQVAAGYGINAMSFLPSVSTDQILITADFFDNALFGYRFESLTNTSNLAWDLPQSSDGYESGDIRYPGTRERGFRGLAVDQSGNVFASSRTDNAVYKIARTEFERAKTTDISKGRNTRGYPKDTATHRLIALDDITTDEIFPRLGEMVTDCPQTVGPLAVTCGGAVATRAWVLGLGTQKVYRIAVGAATSTASSKLSGVPQSILWHPSENILYVAEPEANRVDILDADTLGAITQLANP